MRAGLSTVQQTLTSEAATVLTQSIAEASRRNHSQTTPLHVAATLLASPSGFLRQACIRSHPNSSHPLQCRALELCFSVALERLPTAANIEGEPPISNALMAALKRAQANQRRGCPEQQQQPLLAVKVELEHLIISILDDPSVSRVMREASFSSPSVKSTIEKTLINGGFRSIAPPSPPQLFLNSGNLKGDDGIQILETMVRSKNRNPVLVGDSNIDSIVTEFFKKLKNNELILKNVDIITMAKVILFCDKTEIGSKIEELGGLIEDKIRNGGVILDLGDLKCVVDSETGRMVVAGMTKLLARFDGGGGNRLWLIGTATCETYLRCQIYHPTMERDLDLQAMHVASRLFVRPGTERIMSNPMDSLNPMRPVTVPIPLPVLSRMSPQSSDPVRTKTFCPQCSDNYEKELGRLAAIEKSFSDSSLPQWLRSVKLSDIDTHATDEAQGKDHGFVSKQNTQELQKKWSDTCLHLHPNFHQNSCSGRPCPPSLYNPSLLSQSPFQAKIRTTKPLGEALKLNMNQVTSPLTQRASSRPGSPVRTDLVLGQKDSDQDQAKDFLGCISLGPMTKLLEKFSNSLEADTYKKLLKGLMEKAWWQVEAASAVASAVTRWKLGSGKRRGARGDIWLLFTGPDRIGKKKMAYSLGEHICGASPVVICLCKRREEKESDFMSFRGKNAINRVAEAVRRNPCSVIMLEDIDEADMLVRGSIKRAIERGRLTDSHGREIGLGNAIFIVTGDWSTTDTESLPNGHFVDEKKLASTANAGWQLGLVIREKSNKRRLNWSDEDDRPLKLGSGLSLDLNLSTTYHEDDKTDLSHNSSDLTMDHDSLVNRHFSITSVPHDLVSNVDDSIVFKPVESNFVRREIRKTISTKFSMIAGENLSIEIDDAVLEKILRGLWHDQTSLVEWMDNVVGPSFEQLKTRFSSRNNLVVRLVVDSDYSSRGNIDGNADWLPSRIII